MRLKYLHIHLVDANNCQHVSLTPDFRHTVYYNPSNKRKFAFPKKESVKPELVYIGCTYLGVDVPDEVIEALKIEDSPEGEAKGGIV